MWFQCSPPTFISNRGLFVIHLAALTSHGSCRIVPQGLVVRYGFGLDALCNIKSIQINTARDEHLTAVRTSSASTFPFASCRGGAAPRPVPGRLHTHHHRLRHSLLSLRAAGQLARTATRFTPHIAAIPVAATFVSTIPSAHQSYATRSPASHGNVHGQPLPTLHCTVNRELSGRFFRRLHTFSFAILSEHAISRLACQPARSLPAAFGGQLLQGSVCNWFGQQPLPAFQLLRHHAADPYGP